MTRTPLTFVPALVTLFLASSASALVAPAEECGETADCAEGYTCEKSVSSPGCDPDQDEPCSTDPVVEEIGYCVLAPVTCASDNDCGEYESCQSEEALTCWQGSDGSSGCEEADPDARSYCGPIEVDCTSDTDCPREFECVLVDDLCDCPEDDAECSADCAESDEWACQPKAIDCTSDDQCPTDWSCSGGLSESCSGGGSTGVGGAAPGPDEPTTDEPAPDEPLPDSSEEDADLIPTECTTETVVGQCYPTVWDVTVGGDSAGEDGGEPGSVGGVEEGGPKGVDSDESSDDGDEASSDAGGCSVARAPSSGAAPWLLSLLLLVPFARRRRAAVENF